MNTLPGVSDGGGDSTTLELARGFGELAGEILTRGFASGDALPEKLEYSCPRCHQPACERFYGPCGACRAQLNERYSPAPPVVTKRRWRRLAPTPRWAVVDWSTGRAITDRGARLELEPSSSVARLLSSLPADVARVHLAGPRPYPTDAGAFWQWANAPAGEGWSVDGSHYTESAQTPTLRWRHESGRRLEMTRAAGWFDETDAPVGELRRALEVLEHLVRSKWTGDGVQMLATPATLGRDLLWRSIPEGVEYPVLSSELAELIRSTSGQGRWEVIPRAHDELEGLFRYDGRVMYAALCRELPAGVPERVDGEHAHGPYARSRVRAAWTVPAGWSHVGILPEKEPGAGWRYPSTPGARASGWIDGVELALARAQGWSVEVLESLVWAPVKPSPDPLGLWSRRLLELRSSPALEQETETVRELVRRALRNVIIKAIGAFHAHAHTITETRPIEDDGPFPEGAKLPRIEGGRWVWRRELPAKWPEMQHPEWSAAIWARCRARMLDGPAPKIPGAGRTGALHVPARDVVAFRTDALYLERDPRWLDDGKPGRLELELAHPRPVPTPRTGAELVRLVDELEGTVSDDA